MASSYDEFVLGTFQDPLIKNYSLILLGRQRHLKIQLLYNRVTGHCYSTKKLNNLQDILRRRFGEDAIGVWAAGEVWYDEEELMRSGLVVDQGRYHVLYDDDTPSYSEATQQPPVHHLPCHLPTFQQLESNTVPVPSSTHDQHSEHESYGNAGGGNASPRVHRVHGFTYYSHIPDFSRSVLLRLSNGTHRPFHFHNKDVRWLDQLIHFLSLEGGDRWIGVKLDDGQEFLDDSFMFHARVREGAVVQVTYRQPPAIKLMTRRLEKKRQVVYATLKPEI